MGSDVDTARPLPEPTPVTQPFWDAARRHELTFPQCRSCDKAFFPPHWCCPFCRSDDWSWQVSAGVGTLYSHTVVHRAPQPGFDPPYVIGVIDLDEGFELMSNVVGIDPADVTIGMRMRVTWLAAGDFVLPVFEPDRSQEAL